MPVAKRYKNKLPEKARQLAYKSANERPPTIDPGDCPDCFSAMRQRVHTKEGKAGRWFFWCDLCRRYENPPQLGPTAETTAEIERMRRECQEELDDKDRERANRIVAKAEAELAEKIKAYDKGVKEKEELERELNDKLAEDVTASWYYHTRTSVRKEQIEEKHKKDIEKLERKIEAVKGRLKKNLKAQKTLRDRITRNKPKEREDGGVHGQVKGLNIYEDAPQSVEEEQAQFAAALRNSLRGAIDVSKPAHSTEALDDLRGALKRLDAVNARGDETSRGPMDKGDGSQAHGKRRREATDVDGGRMVRQKGEGSSRDESEYIEITDSDSEDDAAQPRAVQTPTEARGERIVFFVYWSKDWLNTDGCAMPKVLKGRLVMPKAPMEIEGLAQALKLLPGPPLEIYDPEKSDWVGRSVYAKLVDNPQKNGIWLLRGKDVEECLEFDRFVAIVTEHSGMPSLEASTAKMLSEVGRAWTGKAKSTRDETEDIPRPNALVVSPSGDRHVREIFIVWWSKPWTDRRLEAPRPKLFKVNASMPTTLYRLEALVEAMGLKVEELFDVFDPRRSSWERHTIHAKLRENGTNHIWLMRRKTVGWCKDFSRFLRILIREERMPELEGRIASVVEENQTRL